ncbi:MAG: Mut7-C RNAse domain-containing protein [Syntrophobacteraceae bacterium]
MSSVGDPGKRFAVDVMLGKLAKWLRVLGFDASIRSLQERAQIESILSLGIIPVTRRDKWRGLEGVAFIRGDHHFEQLKELIAGLPLRREELLLFSRCGVCNVELLSITRDAAFGKVPDFVFETAVDFRKCPECERVYWPGTHKKRMIEKVESLFDPDCA